KRDELVTIDMVEQEDTATEHRSFVNWLEGTRRGKLLGIHHYFQVTRVEFFHAALEHDATAVDEHEIGQNVLDLFHLMCRHHDGAAVIEVIVQERIVELFPIKDVEPKRRLVQHQ